jgi:hypothetical protein
MLKMPINWMKFAETMSSMNPYGPVIMSDGSIYSPDGRMLAPATATLDLTGPSLGRRPAASAPAVAVAA